MRHGTSWYRGFDGDGKADLLWRTDGGDLAIWEMNGNQIKAADYLRIVRRQLRHRAQIGTFLAPRILTATAKRPALAH